MKFDKRWPLYLLLIVVAVLGTLWAWRVSLSEAGWMPHVDQWAHVITDILGVEHWKLGDQDPAAQAQFWLSELESIGPADDNPDVAMGAAWMLDAPQFGFIRRHVRMKDGMEFAALPARFRRELDHETIATMTEEFERLCRQACLAAIERAVRLDEANPEVRRARALLLFQAGFMSLRSAPRQDDWLSVLDECARGDPDNALYDYLAALHLWTSSGDYDWEKDGYVLNVEDKGRFEEGNARLAAGTGKPHLRFGTDGYAATFEFLEETSVSRSDYLSTAGSRQISSRATNLLYRIMKWEFARSDVEKRAGRFDEAVVAMRRVLTISEQVTVADNYPDLSTARLILRQWSLANLEDIHGDHPNLLSADEAGNVSLQLGEVQRELKILEEAGRRMAARAGTSVSEVSPGTTARVQRNLLSGFLMVTAQMLVIVCFALALMSSLMSLLVGRNDDADPVTFGWGRHIVAWLIAVGVSFIILGMFPAEIVSASVQTWLVCGAIWLGFGAVFLGLLYLFGTRFKLPAGQVAGLAISISLLMIAVLHPAMVIDTVVAGTAALHPVLSISLVLLLALFCRVTIHLFWKFVRNQNLSRRRRLRALGVVFLIVSAALPAAMALGMMIDEIDTTAWIPPAIWKEAQDLHFESEELRNAVAVDDSNWAWAIIQWQVHHGPVVAPLIAMVIVVVWQSFRRTGRVEGGVRQILRSRKARELRQSGRSIAGSCVVAAFIFLALYLGTSPRVADTMGTSYRVLYARMARPALAWEEIEELSGEIRADKDTMVRLQAEIDERNRQIAEHKALRDE